MGIKIKHRDGCTTELQSDGQFWLSSGEANRKPYAYFSPASMTHHTLNAFMTLGVPQKYPPEKYIPIYDDILRHADDFKIKKLRVLFKEIEKTNRGDLLVVRYGYVQASQFPHLIRKRKSTMASSERKVRLLKISDFEMHHK